MSGMVPEDVYELTGASDPRVSPDGRTVAHVVWRIDKETNEYRSNVWMTALDGSSPPTRFTFGARRDAAPRWSPDGSQLAFASNRADEKVMDLYVIPVAGGEPRRLTTCKQSVADPAWSPDGSRIAFASRVQDEAYEEEDDKKRKPRRFTKLWFKLDNVGWTGDRRQHLFVVPADGSEESRQVTDGDFDDGEPAWSPDGSRLAFASSRGDDWDVLPVRDIYLSELNGSESAPVQVTKGDGACGRPSWSPDGSRIAYAVEPEVWDSPRHPQIAVIPAEGGEARILTRALDRNCSPYPGIREPLWDGEDLLFAAEDHGNDHVYRVAADGSNQPTLVVGGDRMVSGYDVRDGSVVYTASTPVALDELFAGDRQLTQVGKAFVEGRELVAPERFMAISKDGTEVEAWVIRPAGFEPGTKYPTLLNIHGGPFTQYGNKFFDEFQVEAGAGYAVLYSNPRGSSGYSEEWGRAIRGTGAGDPNGPGFGTVDYEDCLAVVDTALARFDFIDPDRLGVLGGSYGGYMTSWIVGHTDRFKAAISERALNSWLSFRGSSDINEFFKGYFGKFVFEDPDAFLKMSPTTYATNITTPLLILHSENDQRCPIEQGEQLFTTLRLLKREVEMVRFPGESHELTRSGNPVHRVMRFDVVLDWFDRHLK
jgi:dipeptidyl aminopeptidase/acylaminoacyl peptidase